MHVTLPACHPSPSEHLAHLPGLGEKNLLRGLLVFGRFQVGTGQARQGRQGG